MKKRMLLSAPVRLYWELAPDSAGGLPSARAFEVASEAAAMKVFFVTIRLSGGVRGDLSELAYRLTDGGVNLKLSVSDVDSVPDGEAAGLAGGLEVFVDRPDGDLGAGLDEIHSACTKTGLTPTSVAAVPSRGNAGTFAGFFSRCVELGLSSISLPNPNVIRNPAGADPYILDELSRDSICAAAESVLGDKGGTVKLFVHELFLYRKLNVPGMSERMEYAGCQAAEAVAFIGPDGLVYPCSSWPEPLGSILENSFTDIWSGSLRKGVVDRIGTLPSECRGCSDKDACFGGCRGLAAALNRGDAPDPGCPVITDD